MALEATGRVTADLLRMEVLEALDLQVPHLSQTGLDLMDYLSVAERPTRRTDSVQHSWAIRGPDSARGPNGAAAAVVFVCDRTFLFLAF